jgi:hypothetical protein
MAKGTEEFSGTVRLFAEPTFIITNVPASDATNVYEDVCVFKETESTAL